MQVSVKYSKKQDQNHCRNISLGVTIQGGAGQEDCPRATCKALNRYLPGEGMQAVP